MAAEHPASTVGLDLTSWEEAEAYFGLELPENAYLQERLQSGFRAALSSDSEGPTALEWTAEYLDSGVRLEVWVTAYTQRMELPGSSGQPEPSAPLGYPVHYGGAHRPQRPVRSDDHGGAGP